MPFNSFKYLLVFFPVVCLALELARRWIGPRAAQATLLLASLVFYGWSRPANLPLLLGSILVNWAFAQGMAKLPADASRRRVLVLGLTANIAFLGVFKYVNFFLRGLFALGVPRFAFPDWEFPLGISFFTLQQVMYLVDCYEGMVPASGLADHATFVGFYPYVISGPLARAKSMVGQFHRPALQGDRFDAIARGLYLVSIGLFKKVVFADSFGRVADLGFAAPNDSSTLEAWVCSVCYSLQLYFDFSGYSDMAIGSALVLGFEIPRNFNAPYRATTVTEFWQRWHISLSSFITTYLYTPILRSFRKATLATASVATLLSMTIAGLWHGPSWNFVVFGTMHGTALVINQYWKKKKMRKLPGPLAWALTFGFVNLAFIVFRAPDMATAAHLAALLVPRHGGLGTSVIVAARAIGVASLAPPLIGGVIAAFYGKSSDELAQAFRPSYLTALATALMILLSCLYMNSAIVKQFVYFNF